jgi:arsenite methyltransferase
MAGSFDAMAIDLQELRGYISNMYADVARFPRGDFHFPIGRPILEALGYPPQELDRIPPAALESFAGVGFHMDLDPLKEGESVLDIGSGAGTDSFYAALRVGKTGSVVGLDMTDAMLEKSERTRAEHDFAQVRFQKGHAEELPFADSSFDAVISNGVINLTPEKKHTFSQIHRVLKPGGRLMFSDIVTGVTLPESVRENCTLWAECIGGAVEQNAYLGILSSVGFTIESSRQNPQYQFKKDSTTQAALKFQVRSLSILARKPRAGQS